MREIEYQSNGQPIAVNFEDLKEKLGYKTYKPRIGILGQALIKLAKEGNQRSIGWLKEWTCISNFFIRVFPRLYNVLRWSVEKGI